MAVYTRIVYTIYGGVDTTSLYIYVAQRIYTTLSGACIAGRSKTVLAKQSLAYNGLIAAENMNRW
jgi:hypothetical protein